MDGIKNLVPVRTTEEAREKGRKGGLASAEARRRKKSMRETAKMVLSMNVVGDANKENLKKFGIEESDQNYQTALVVRLIQKALVEGDTNAIKTIAQLTGELNGFGYVDDLDNSNTIDMEYPYVSIPDNGRDKVKKFQLSPQAGPQTQFMASSADIVIYGGAAGGGKTYALLMEVLRHKDVKDFQAAIFRHNFTQVTNPGGLWDASNKLYNQVLGATSGKTPKLHWNFNGNAGGKLTFAHIGCEDDLQSWQGSEICYIGFDELTHFSKHQFLYMLSRNRSTCGIKPYVRATCNPDSDSWVAEFISWWIDQDTGYAISERSGNIRWMAVINDAFIWFDSKESGISHLVTQGYEQEEAEVMIKSVCFIASRLQDNRILMETDPGYLANLNALSVLDRERLLMGNWKIKAAAGLFFKRSQFNMLEKEPDDIIMYCRAWDIAATSDKESEGGDPDFTSSTLMGVRSNGKVVILNVTNQRISAGDVEKTLLFISQADRKIYGFRYKVRIPQDPGAAGKIVAKRWASLLMGFNVKVQCPTGSKEVRATPFSAQVQLGNVDCLKADWNDMFFSQAESFPQSKHDDMIDSSADAFNELTGDGFDVSSLL